MSQIIRNFIKLSVVFSFLLLIIPQHALAASAAQIDRDVNAALDDLFAGSAAAQTLANDAKAILVFPDVVKAGLIIGGQYGEGALLKAGKNAGYYNTVAASYGLQAGAQKFGYALFFLSDKALAYLESSKGWEIGVGPSVVVVDEGISKSLTTTTAKGEIYAFFFNQKGLMAGLGLQGSKISRITPDK